MNTVLKRSMSVYLLLILAGMSSTINGADVRTNEVLGEVKSPCGSFWCHKLMVFNKDGGREEGERVFVLSSATPGKRELIFEAIRCVDIKWSPDDRYFAIEDHNDGHSTGLFIFMINEIVRISKSNREERTWHVDRVYASPLPGRGESHWSIGSWDLANGTVQIKCEYLAEEDWLLRPMKFTKRSYVVPIDYRRPVNKTPRESREGSSEWH